MNTKQRSVAICLLVAGLLMSCRRSGRSPGPEGGGNVHANDAEAAPNPSLANAAGPALFFTDLISGPKSGGQNDLGAFITIYGEGFGVARGTSTVTIGGVEAANYVLIIRVN
jgi:hypothetical protein